MPAHDDPPHDAPALRNHGASDGWQTWELSDPTRFNAVLGPLQFKLDGPLARLRMIPEHRHSNLRDIVHGGALLTFIDLTLFAASRSFSPFTAGSAVTLDISTQFVGGARIGEPIEGQVELIKETGRLFFLRGLIVQGEGPEAARIAVYSGIVQKMTTPPR